MPERHTPSPVSIRGIEKHSTIGSAAIETESIAEAIIEIE